MYSFILCAVILIASYFIYGKAIEKLVGIDENNTTPAYKLQDGVDYLPIPKLKAFLIHFLQYNIDT